MNGTKTNPAGWILYDDSCEFCRRWIPFWENTLRQRGFEIAPLQAPWVKEKLKLNGENLSQDLRLLLADGKSIEGADTYRYATKRIWWAYPVYVFSVLPLGRNVFDWCYRKFAANRYRISVACNLDGKTSG